MGIHYHLSLDSYAWRVIASPSMDNSNIKYLNTTCNDINRKEMILHRALAWTVIDNILFYGLGFITAGVSFLFTPLWRYYITKRNCSKIRIGNLRCRMNGDINEFIDKVIILPMIFNICSFGLYSLLGFGMRHENEFYDDNIEWYYDDFANVDQ